MENYYFKIKRKFYPGETDLMPPQLPSTYVSETQYTVPSGQNCEGCYFFDNGFCNYWKSDIREDFWCPTYTLPQTPVGNLPSPPPCLTGFTVPIVITEDFNDIGVYTPFDGLVIQRDIINNFLYEASNYTVTVQNTSDLEFKRFLTFGDYTVDWGDGSSSTLSLGALTAQHTYPAISDEYKITLTQINPWGTTRISKKINLPYTTQINIPNPFGTVEIHPPNLGDPIACESIYQDYIFSGDSNPDVYDYFSFNYVSVPYSVTGYTNTNNLTLFSQYGNNGLPNIGETVQLIDNLSGEILDINSDYTAYTINDIVYTYFSDGETFFDAKSTGWNENNLEWKCCDETVTEECQCSEFGNVIPKGEYNPNVEYMRGVTVKFGDCCWYCNPTKFGIYSCTSDPAFESVEWLPCEPCNKDLSEEKGQIERRIGSNNYNPSFIIKKGEKVSYLGRDYEFQGTRIINEETETMVDYVVGWIDLKYVKEYVNDLGVATQEVVPYEDQNGMVWTGGYTTSPQFNLTHYENLTQTKPINYSLWLDIT